MIMHSSRSRISVALGLALAWSWVSPASAATVSLRAFDRIAQTVELAFLQSGTSEIQRRPMEKILFGIWQADFEVPAGSYEYRFIADGEWISDISNPDYKRWEDGSVWSVFSVPGENDSFSNCRLPPAPPPPPRRHVVLTYADPRSRSVEVAGEFNGWSRQPLHRTDDGTWRLSFDLPEGAYAYKLIADEAWILDPANPHRKTLNNIENSELIVSAETAAAPEPTAAPAAPAATGETVAVTFRFYAPLANSVSVVGTFNNWNGEQNRMSAHAGMWTCTLPLPAGTCEYKFKADDNWFWDPDHPPQDPGGNSVITVQRRDFWPDSNPPLIRAADWTNAVPILLEPATGLHAFQQELLRAYVYVLGSDKYNLRIADGSLLNPDRLPPNPPARWGWAIDSSAGLPMMTLTVASNTAAFELRHPLLAPPREWLAEQQRAAKNIFGNATLDLTGPASPPATSAWAVARQALTRRQPFADVHAVNLMTAFGRQCGWSQALLRDLATTYADMSVDYRFPGIGGWAPMVFAARAVVYADLARAGKKTDETMAYVLCRIGRPGDGAAFLPARPRTFYGRLAAAMARGESGPLLALAGSPDHYGLELAAGQASHAPVLTGLSAARKAQILLTLADAFARDGQENLARCYTEGAFKFAPDDFASHIRALDRGGVGAGHRHARKALELSGCSRLWTSVLENETPCLCATERPHALAFAFVQPQPEINLDEEIARVSTIFADAQYEILDDSSVTVPPAAGLLLLRDMLNTAWWHNARYEGTSYSSKEGCQRLNQTMATWKPLQPEMEAFTRFIMTYTTDDHDYGAIQRGFTDSARPPATLDYVRMVRQSFRTWLMDKAQSFYPLTPTVQSDLYPDYEASEDIYVFQSLDHLRANCRRLDPMAPYGYPLPGALPKPDQPAGIPDALFNQSYALNRKLAADWARTFEPENQAAAIAFFQRCLKIAPYEVDALHDYADVLLDNGKYPEVIALAESSPDTMEGLEQVAMYRLGTFAALALGDTHRALPFAKSAAASWQSISMSVYAYVLEITGQAADAEQVLRNRDERYNSNRDIYMLARQQPEEAEKQAQKLFAWIEQFPDLEQANRDGRFSFNALKDYPYIYASLDRWDRALWLIKPLAEGVQNDFIWFMVITVGLKTGDQATLELGQHVLANHVFNAWGDFARFMRRQATWETVLNSARNNHTPQPMYYTAALMAEQRGDPTLAVRLYKQTLDPRFTTGPWFTMAWRALQRLDCDPRAFVRRNFPAD